MNKNDPNAQKKFLEVSAAYDVLKNPDKRQQYDMQRTGGFYNTSEYPNQGSSSYTQQQRSYQGRPPNSTGYNPYTQQNYGNPFGFDKNQEEMMFRQYAQEFADMMNEGSYQEVIHEKMPDGSVRVKVVKRGGRTAKNQHRVNNNPINNPFGSFGLFGIFKTIGVKILTDILQGFAAAGDFNQRTASRPFIGGFQMANGGQLRESFASTFEYDYALPNSRYIKGSVREDYVNGYPRSISYVEGGSVISKATQLFPDGVETIEITTGGGKRLISAIQLGAWPFDNPNEIGIITKFKRAFNLFYHIVDARNETVGFYRISPMQKDIEFFDIHGTIVGQATRVPTPTKDTKRPYLNLWTIENDSMEHFSHWIYLYAPLILSWEHKNRGNNTIIPTMWRALTKLNPVT